MKLLTYEDAAECCQMSVAWIRKQVRLKRLKVVRFGHRHPRIRVEDLERFVGFGGQDSGKDPAIPTGCRSRIERVAANETVSTKPSPSEQVARQMWDGTIGKSIG